MNRGARSPWFYLALVSLITSAGVLCAWNNSPQENQAGTDKVQYFDHQKADAVSWQRAALYPFGNGNFSVLTARRNKPGEVEIHQRDTDILYVVDGSATFVTAGKILNPTTKAPEEIRGTGMEGGTPYHLSKGDIIVVPHGVPHWFKEVPSQVFYFVVKVR